MVRKGPHTSRQFESQKRFIERTGLEHRWIRYQIENGRWQRGVHYDTRSRTTIIYTDAVEDWFRNNSDRTESHEKTTRPRR